MLITSIVFAFQIPSWNEAVVRAEKDDQNWLILYSAAEKRNDDPATVREAIGDYYAVFDEDPYIYTALEMRGTADYYDVDIDNLYENYLSSKEGTQRVKRYRTENTLKVVLFFLLSMVSIIVYLNIRKKR